MPIVSLLRHPDSPCEAIGSVSVEYAMQPTGLQLCYRIIGNIDQIKVPTRKSSQRTAELWKHTCYELFIGGVDVKDYLEFNFSPSREWAAYQFSDYRTGMCDANIDVPAIRSQSTESEMELQVALNRNSISLDMPVRLGLSCVIEERTGRISYWALAHPVGKADFHHRDSFTLELL
jgi:hypothetical protein